jgi:hypothetical protein
MLYTEFVVALLMHVLTIVQLFIDKLFYVLVTTNLLSLVVIVITADMM